MDELYLREYIDKLIKKHGGVKAKEILFKEIEKTENYDMMLACAKYGERVMISLLEQENSTIH
jgi:hypothetical protein